MKMISQAALWTAFVLVTHFGRAADLPMLVTSGDSNQILEYNPNGSFDKVFATTRVGATAEGQNPSEIVKGPDGNIYVGYWGSGFPSGTGGIERFDAAGNLTGNTPLNGSVAGLTFAPDGTLYAAAVNASNIGQIERVSWPSNQAAGTPSSVATVGGSGLRSIAAIPGSGGTYTIAYDTAGSTLSSIHPNGSAATTYTGLGTSQQFGVDVRSDGVLFVSQLNGNLYSVNTNVSTTFSVFASPGSASPALSTPLRFAFDGSNNVYVVNNGENNIAEYSPTGTFLGNFVSTGSGGLSGPQGLLFLTTPEPSSAVLAGIAGVAALAVCVRRLRGLRPAD